MHTDSDYSWAIVSKPEDAATNEPLPPDGYGWLDDEVLRERKTLPGAREIEVYERLQGFDTGETMASVSRRRYRLFGGKKPEMCAMHYVKHEGPLVPVTPAQIKVHPSARLNPYRYPAQATAPAPPGVNPVVRHKVAAKAAAVQATAAAVAAVVGGHAGQQGQRAGMKVGKAGRWAESVVQWERETWGTRPHPDDGHETTGDDMDQLTLRDVALERYMRNHESMAEILSPFQATQITPPDAVPKYLDQEARTRIREEICVVKFSPEALRSLSFPARIRDDISAMAESHKAATTGFQERAAKVWQAYEKVEQVENKEALTALIQDYEVEHGVTIESSAYRKVHTVVS
ncbi:hypothetical protein HDU93_009631 [Gonapodya sp. JEL0774]|nr:hypothetical protein HDU93_009631 [Gonapodya sp. JEL0774]